MNKTVDHWIAVADTLKQQRDQAEKERDAMKARAETAEADTLGCAMEAVDRAMKAEAERYALRQELDAILTKRSQIVSVGAILEEVETIRAEKDALRKDMEGLRLLVSHDSYAMSFQTMGQYRTALQEVLDAALEVKELGGVKAECDALRKDAARLDWLESEKVFRASYYPVKEWSRWVLEATDVTEGATLREAIDAAMEATP
jgi:hypothetical protein